jgi:hypothetical protein
LFPLGVDCGDQVRQRHVAICGEFVEPILKGILNADARLVSGDQDRMYDDERFLLIFISRFDMAKDQAA